jgi:hypothetical protein
MNTTTTTRTEATVTTARPSHRHRYVGRRPVGNNRKTKTRRLSRTTKPAPVQTHAVHAGQPTVRTNGSPISVSA